MSWPCGGQGFFSQMGRADPIRNGEIEDQSFVFVLGMPTTHKAANLVDITYLQAYWTSLYWPYAEVGRVKLTPHVENSKYSLSTRQPTEYLVTIESGLHEAGVIYRFVRIREF